MSMLANPKVQWLSSASCFCSVSPAQRPTVQTAKVTVEYTRSRLYGHRIYGLFGYMVNFWEVPISLSTIKLTIYPEFDLNFGYMVNF